MPSAKTHSALSRQWELLQHLPKRAPGITVSELLSRLVSAGYSISRRSVERDLRDLSVVFPLQCNNGGTPFGWYWKPGVSVELQGITLAEAVSLTLVEDAIRPLLPGSMLSVLEPRFEHARQKLKGLEDGNPTARWPDKVASVRPDFNLHAPQILAETLEALQHAVISEQQVHCHYYSAHTNKISELTLNPLAIVQRGLITYLIATAAPYTDVRQFAVHRFREVTVLDTQCQGVASFELHTYLAAFGTHDQRAQQAFNLSARAFIQIINRHARLAQALQLRFQHFARWLIGHKRSQVQKTQYLPQLVEMPSIVFIISDGAQCLEGGRREQDDLTAAPFAEHLTGNYRMLTAIGLIKQTFEALKLVEDEQVRV
ncbi:helix-turn-helix transcriptional regulator [Pseudomonas fragi]|uniref:Transcriptional factor MdcH n=1 Tax=Pseudomonas fragi TaxID=296 RepID=A0A449IRH1_PSEFR|nr:WYL domain-containing protein [Pseudomonas fragi]VFB22012.1 transcriptional factor MdcH [Pseudomonas fragi]